MAHFPRVILIVLDSVGIGELPDAAAYGDEGSNTLGNIVRAAPVRVPTLASLGLDLLVPALGRSATLGQALGAYARMAEASAGK